MHHLPVWDPIGVTLRNEGYNITATEDTLAFAVSQDRITHGMKSSPLPSAPVLGLFVTTTVEMNSCMSESTTQRERRSNTGNTSVSKICLGKKIKNTSRAVFCQMLWSRLMLGSSSFRKAPKCCVVFEKNKWSNYSNQSFKASSGSVGGKTLKNCTKKPCDEMQSFEKESGLLKIYKLLFCTSEN